MKLKNYLIFATYFLVKNAATAINVTDIYSLKKIEFFINNIHSKGYTDYEFRNVTMDNDGINRIIRIIINDLINILEDLNKISSDSRYDDKSRDLFNFIAKLDHYRIMKGRSLISKLTIKLRSIFDMKETINSFVRSLFQLNDNNYFNSPINYCPFVTNITQVIRFQYRIDTIIKEYEAFVDYLEGKMDKESHHNFCGQTSSFNKEIYEFYSQIIATYLKEFIMLYYIDIMERRCLNQKPTIELSTSKASLIAKLREPIDLTKYLLQDGEHYMYRCDATTYHSLIAPKYYELERMIQMVIIEEKNLSTTGSCTHNCNLNNIDGTINYGECKEYRDCQHMKSDYEICESSGIDYSSRHYEWFKNSNGTIFGDNSTEGCKGTIKLLSSYYNASEDSSCDHCLCTCIRKPQSYGRIVTAISFREQVTNIDDNMIAVGVRFIKKDGLIHIQLKEGKLKPKSSDKSMWKELEHFAYDEKTGTFNILYANYTKSPAKLGVDYAHPETINFDDLIAPEGYGVTGVRFRFADDSIGRIQLQIRVTPFDYTSGELIDRDQTHWIAQESKDLRHPLDLHDPDKPTKIRGNVIDSKTDKFIEFRASDLKKDAGQSTVPFFDAQDVEGDPEFPLGGVGIMHRGRKGYGGFLTLRIFDLNLAHYFNDE